MGEKIKYLEMIQKIILQMNKNSFLIKGWNLTIVSALFAIAVKNENTKYIYIAILPVIMFWILDGYFLWQEKLYRKLYDNARKEQIDKIDFNMNTKLVHDKVDSWSQICLSKTLLIYHGAILFIIFCIIVIE